MPHKYQREIEEILRNMEQDEPRHNPGERVRSMPGPTSSPSRLTRRGAPSIRLAPLEALMAVSILLALVAAAVAYTVGVSLVSGALGLVAFVVFAFSCVAGWMEQSQGMRAPRVWRGRSLEPAPITMRQRGFFSEIATQMRILRLKWRYWRSHEH